MNQRNRRGRLWRWAAVLAAVGYLAAQEAQPPDETDPAAGDVVFRTETALMEVEVRATLRRGELVEGLTREDFQLFENGEPQEIVSFEYVDYPRGEALVARGGRLTQAAGIESPDPSQRSSAPRPSASQELRIFIATHVSEAERLRVRKTVRKFIENDLPDHALVSLNGTPFVSDRELLLAFIDKAGLVDVLSGNNFTEIRPQAVSDFDSELAAQRQDWNALLRGVDPTTPTQLFNIYDDHISRIRTLRYVDLIRDLSVYPGKKIIVLFSRGHSMGFDRFQQGFMGAQDSYLLERLKGESMRARISLYAVDARGLEVGAVLPEHGFGMTGETIFSPEQIMQGVPAFLLGRAPLTAGMNDSYQASQQGLRVLAEMTDGVAVINSNDLGEIFDHVRKDLGGYYLIGYSPPKRKDSRRMRQVKIAVNRPEVRLKYRKGFYDDEEFRRALAEDQRKRLEKLLGPSPSKTTDNAPLPSLTLYKTAFEALASDAPNYVQAAENLQRAVQGYPRFAVAWNVLGYSREQLGDEQAAREAYEKAAQADSDYLQPQAHLARLDIRDQQWDSAKRRSEAILSVDEKRADALFYLATAEYNLDDLDAARQAAEAVAGGPHAENYPEVLQLLGRVRTREGDYAGATEAYRSYLKVRPGAVDRNLVEEQISRLETAEDVEKINAAVQAADWTTVVELGEQLAEVDEESGLGLYFAAMAHLQLNDYGAARAAAEAVLRREDSDRFPGVHRMLGTLYARESAFEAAAGQYRELIAKVPDAPDLTKLQQQLVDWEKLLRYEERRDPVVRVINPTGRTAVIVARGPLRIAAESSDRPLRQGDVVMTREPGLTVIECVAKDARINVALELPYGLDFEGKSESGDISMEGMVISGKVETRSGAIDITAPWEAMRLDAKLQEQPAAFALPEGGLLEAVPEPGTSALAVGDTHSKRKNTYGRVEVRAAAPRSVVFRNMDVPADSVVKMPWQAPGILDALLSGEPLSEQPPDGPSLRRAEGLAADTVRFSSDVRMVNLSVSVTDEDGTPVTALDESSFEVIEGGVEQQLVSVTTGDAPFNMVVLLDMSASTVEDRVGMKLVARRFVAAARPEDRIAVYTLGNELFTVVSPLSSDRDDLAQRIDALPPMSGGSPLYDSIVLAYNEELRARAGQRNALVIISDGVDNQLGTLLYKPIPENKKKNKRWLEYQERADQARRDLLAAASEIEFGTLRQAAGRVETLIYPFLVRHGSSERRFRRPVEEAAKNNMEALAAASGGRVFYAAPEDQLDPFREVTEELRSVYTLAYYPKNQEFDGAWRPVEVWVNRPGVTVRTRKGYVAR